ncbi:putative porin [Vibrio crassostreae]|uniref:porin n=1 Tax=Vibrio crassostreae TaxID=246167 RepID=UPI0010513CBD|nr:porin [Vibrio crassostreae]TCN91822.1 putative porin [Vibrio crassostreae]CAK2433209.1 putative porin [Vibrio crassostreae]CAK2513502.1 putative porin [Vibrio crassostreae]CAK3766950.1 putative porin [Vibrio crassostreae]CAK4028931.1 putative porin [Vibrio crassostreae]
MKKTLLALAVMTAAGSANAAIELYNQDGVTVNLKGDIEVVYKNSLTTSSMEQRIEDADFGFDIKYMVNDEWKVGAYWEFDGSPSTNSKKAQSGDAYVAAYHNTMGSIKFGRTCTAVDDLGIGKDEAFGIATLLDAATNECADEAIRYDYDNGDLYATLGYVQDKVDNDTKDVPAATNNTYYDVRVGYRFTDIDLSAFVANLDADKANMDHQGYGAELVFSGIENVYLSTAYYAVTSDTANDDTSTIAFAAGYTMGLWGFNTGYSIGDHDDNAKDEDVWFVNSTYAVAPNTKVYAEVGGSDVKNSKTGLALGVEASF